MENIIVKIVRISQNLKLPYLALSILYAVLGVNGYGQTYLTKNNYFKTVLLALLLFLSMGGFAQPPSMSVNTDCNGTYSNKVMTQVGAGNNNLVFFYREAASSTTTSGTKFYQFNSDGYNNRWELTTPTYNTTSTAIWSAGGYNAGIKMGATVSGSYYTFNVRKGTSYANQSMSILETSYNPVTINSYTTGLIVAGGQTATVTVTMAGALNSAEYLYVAYSTDGFATSGNSGVVAIPSINGSFQGNATIPAYTAGTVVSYYPFTSVSATAPTFANVPLLTLNMRNGTAQNTNAAYTSYIVTVAAAITASKIGVNFNGAGTLFKYTVEPSCDTGPGAWTGANLGTLYVGDPIVVTGGNLFANTTLTATQFFYRVWLQSGSGGAYSNFNINTITTPICGNKYETTGGSAVVPLTNYATAGTYNFDVYHQGLNGASTLNLGTAGTPYTATFIVNALNNPLGVSATAASTTSINLTWTKSAQNNNVMVVRYPFGAAITAPTQGTAYVVTNTLGLGTVVYNGGATTSTNSSLAASTQYTYYFYSQNNNFYSSGLSASATTLTPAITAAKIGVNFNGAGTLFKYTIEPSCDTGSAAWTGANLGTLYIGDPIVVTGGNLFANTTLTATQFFYRVWLQSGSGGAYSNFNVTTPTTPTCGNKYETTGGSAVVPLTNYATPGTYNFDVYHQGLNGASTLNLGTAGTPYTATFVVSAINNPSGVSVLCSSTSTQLDLSWTKSAQNNNVMVVRYPFGSAVTPPTQGTAYVATNTLGLGTVVYNGGATTSSNTTGLTANTPYTYYFYSENYGYYSSGVNASGTTSTSQPGVISGTGAQCPSTAGQVYSAIAVAGATSYTWTVPSGWTITAGQTTNSITLTTGVAGQDGTISVVATNACGASIPRTLAVTISSLNFINLQSPATAAICQGSTFVSYGKVYEPGVTDNASQGAGIDVQFGYHSSNTNPSTWPTGNWTAATYDSSVSNDDQYTATFGSSLTIGTYYYTYRYRLNGCDWQYAGYSSSGGGFWNGTSNVNGILTVNNTSPTVTTPTSAALTTTTATLGGDATSIGCSSIIERGIYYSTTNGFLDGSGTKMATTGIFSTGVFTQAVTGLTIATTYYYKAFATNSGGTTYTTQGTFSTISPAIVTTTSATAITATTATSGGNVTADGGTTVTAKGVVYSTTISPLLGGSGVITNAGGTGLGSFTSNLTGLIPGTTYYLNSYATNTTGTAYGSEISFTTPATAPVLAGTTAATFIYCHNTTSGGNVTSDGGGIITERGIVFATTSNPTTSNTKVISSGTTGIFTSNLASLTPLTLYYVRAYATNSAGTTYGTQISFTTTVAPTASSSDFYSDRIYFKNGSNTSEKYYLENNSVPNGGCTGAATETAGTAAWETKNLGTSIAGTTLQLGSFLVSKGKSNGNTPKINYRMYLTSTGPGALAFTQLNMNYVAECDADGVLVNSNTEDKIWRNPLADIVVPTAPGNYTIEIYYERQGDQLGAGGTVYISNCSANYKATIDIIRPTGIFSDAIYFDNGTTVTNHTAAGYDSCNTSLTIESGKWNEKDLGSLDPGKILKISATVLALDGASPVVDGSTNFYYRIYKNGAAVPAYSTMPLPVVTGLICGDTNISKFDQPTLTTLYTTTASNGTYSIELYYSALLSNGTSITRGTSSSPYKATFSILAATPTGERDLNDGNYDPTATNTSGMFESYMGVLVNDDTGTPITGLNRVFDMDGALSSSNSSNFDFGTQNPGLDFNVGTETKVFTKGTHKVCGCSSWNYVYKDGATDPIATDFPLPTAGSLFTDQINGKFILLNSSDNINSNGVFIKQVYPAPKVTAAGSTSDSGYNSSLGTTITQFKDYTDPTVGTVSTINTPVFPVLCPTCSGPYRVAVAMLSWVSTTGNCSNPASFIYHRDINRNKVTDSRIVLNPNHNDAPTSGTGNPSKNSLPGTSLFYISKVNIGATGGTRTWNGSWSGSVPTSKNDVIIAANYSTASGSFTCNDITINTGVVVTIKDDTYIEALNNATTTGTGKIVVENKGNFVQRCDEKAPSAYIEHTKTTETKKNWDYEYWGSPVVQDILTTSLPSAFDRAYYWDGGDGGTGWKTATTGSITTGKGLITRVANIAPYNITPTAIAWQLSGTANNGIYTTPIKDYTAWSGGDAYLDYLDYALIANPYACALDGKTFLSNPRNDAIGKTLYFWTAITPIAKTQYLTDDPWAYNYNPEDYAAWNFTGGVATQTKAATDISGTDVLKPSGKIASGQAFFVEVLDNGTAYFDNSMRLTAGNNQFFKHVPKGNKPNPTDKTFPIKPLGIEEGRVWINISNNSSFRQLLVGYVHGATNDFDPFYDGELYSDSPILIYTSINDKDYAIQGRQLPFDENESIPIGIDAREAGEFYISIDEVDGFFNHQNVILKDNLLGIEHDLKQTAYKFRTNAGRFDNRFELKFTEKSGGLLGVTQEKNNADAVLVFVQNNQLKLISSTEEITAITVFDSSGKKILIKNTINKKEVILDKLSKQNQVILVKIKLANNSVITKKVLF
ncbi:hypothetical protein [Flavobacterium restrictum]|uniref:Fibronectin type-III domain-containing protein n=1 Tax=Flavobacterium restrictum TaxID=2594428 RepID=A0A553DT88_9FLAO|nr:hypothetical protein [Flavobacterium restrictum]TRX35988.1 hypothetical protein FNW21_14305 [Flavobacterium restrictum]